jgi:hypothetical protein
MSVAALRTDMPTAPPPVLAGPRSAPGFEQALATATGTSREDEVRRAAEALVSAAFIEPALATARSGSMAAGPFAPGDAERRFGPLLDQAIAERVVRGAGLPLVDRIAQHFLGGRVG